MPADPAPPPTAPPSASGLLVGRLINGKYDVQAVIAAGGMGKIYRAEQQPLGRVVALKVLHPRLGAGSTVTGSYGSSSDPHFKKRFFREASILAKLSHPNIVTVFDYGKIEGLPQDDEQYFMAMEFLSGETLQQRIHARGPLPTDEVLRIPRQVGRGLREAPAHGIVHRDLKPSNVMITNGRDGEPIVKILDFGIVKLTAEGETTQELTQEGLFIGSPKYMAPEQISSGEVDARSDLYSLGVILYQCLTGKVPFEAETSIQIMMAHLNQTAVPPRERAPELAIPDWLEAIVLRCLEKEPANRPASVEELLRLVAEASPQGMSSLFTGLGSGSPSTSGPAADASTRPSGTLRDRRPSSVPSSVSGSQPRARNSGGITEVSASSSLPGGSPDADLARRNAVIVGGVAAAAIVTIVSVLVFRGATRPAEATPTAPSALAASPRRSFILYIESMPAGAEVYEGDQRIGTTRLQLSLDNDEVGAHPRRFVVKRDGFEPYSIVQGASDDNVRIVASLVAAAPGPSGGASVGALAPSSHVPPARKQGTDHGTSPPASSSDMDIRLKR